MDFLKGFVVGTALCGFAIGSQLPEVRTYLEDLSLDLARKGLEIGSEASKDAITSLQTEVSE